MTDAAYDEMIVKMARTLHARDYEVDSSREPPTFSECNEWYLEAARAVATAAGLAPGRRIIASLGDGRWQDPDGRVYFAREEMIPEASAGGDA